MNEAGEATARDGADSDVEKVDDKFDDEELNGVEPDFERSYSRCNGRALRRTCSARQVLRAVAAAD